MRDLSHTTGVQLKTDYEKKNGQIYDHFGWRLEGRKFETKEKDGSIDQTSGISQQEMELLVRKCNGRPFLIFVLVRIS